MHLARHHGESSLALTGVNYQLFYIFTSKFFFFCGFSFSVLKLITLSVRFAATSLKDLLGDSPVMLCQHGGPQLGASFILNPAPAHLLCHDPLSDLLICFPPSNLLRICI